MSRSFASSSSQYLTYSGAVLSATPLTMACFFNPVSGAGTYTLLSISDSAQSATYLQLHLASNRVRASEGANGVGIATANNVTTNVSNGVWQHACGVFGSSSSRDAFLNGGLKGSNTTTIGAGTLDRTEIGAKFNIARGGYMNGQIAEVGLWSAALTDAEVATLGKGVSPLLVRPQSLVAYWPLIGRASPEIDIRGGFNMTLGGTPTAADHPRIYYPTPRIMYSLPAAAAPTGNPWNYYAQCG